jgi:Papain-like cysteine protease AvrRpt2
MAVLDFQIEHQLQDQWCWAAVAASICGFYQDSVRQTQCQLANQFLSPIQDCCQNGKSDDCNIPFALDLVLNQLNHLVQPPRGVVPFEDLDQEITVTQRPVALRIMFADGFTSHFVVIVGCARAVSGGKVVKVADPSDVTGNVTSMEYSALVSDYRPGAIWDQTYFTRPA